MYRRRRVVAIYHNEMDRKDYLGEKHVSLNETFSHYAYYWNKEVLNWDNDMMNGIGLQEMTEVLC